jgi:hypothetical protein
MYLPSGGVNDIVDAVESLAPGRLDRAMILLAEPSQPGVPELIDALDARGIGFFGAVFPGLISGRAQHQEGAIVQILPLIGEPAVLHLDPQKEGWVGSPPDIPIGLKHPPTICVLVDCLADNISGLLVTLFNHYANSVHYFGAGAGNSGLRKEPSVFTREGIFRNAAVVAATRLEATVRVRHGWSRASGPFVATRTHKNHIQELNWENAGAVYERLLEQDLTSPITQKNFFQATKGCPFGIDKEGQEDVVRDPIRITDKGELVCLSDVPENSVLHVLRGDPDSLVSAAAEAVEASEITAEMKLRACLVSDCYSRALMLGDDFSKELGAVADRVEQSGCSCTPEGVLALGEIASDGEQLPEFYNKTFVVGFLHE